MRPLQIVRDMYAEQLECGDSLSCFATECYWHRGILQGRSVEHFFCLFGIDLHSNFRGLMDQFIYEQLNTANLWSVQNLSHRSVVDELLCHTDRTECVNQYDKYQWSKVLLVRTLGNRLRCGTPETYQQPFAPSRTLRLHVWRRCRRKEYIQQMMTSGRSSARILASRMSWSTRSNALVKSTNTVRTDWPLSTAMSQWCVTSTSAWVVDRRVKGGRQVCWWF